MIDISTPTFLMIAFTIMPDLRQVSKPFSDAGYHNAFQSHLKPNTTCRLFAFVSISSITATTSTITTFGVTERARALVSRHTSMQDPQL